MTKTISLSDEAYNLLKRIKKKTESFSEVIMRVVSKKGGLSELLDLYPELKENSELEPIIEEFEKEFEKKQVKFLNEMP